MPDELIYKNMINMVLKAQPSVLLNIDKDGQISHEYITENSKNSRFFLKGKDFLRILRLVFGMKNASIVYNNYLKCIGQKNSVEIFKMSHINAHGLSEYYNWQFFYLAEADSVLIYARNITEHVLLEDEFMNISEQYQSINQDLLAAMSKLDIQLMDVEQAQKKISALYRITAISQKTVSEQEVLNEILDGITREFGFADLSIWFFDEKKQELTVKAYQGQCKQYENKGPISLKQESLLGYAVLKRELVCVDDITCTNNVDANKSGCLSEVAIPLIYVDKILGVLSVKTTVERILQPYDLDLLRSLASQIAMTIAHASHVSQVQTQAITDGLTGLYNHRYFISLLEQEFKRAMRYKRSLSLMMIDVDYFKIYNDINGHRMGDAVLHTVAELIKDSCRDLDFVGRYGGEEFTVLLPETTVDETYVIAERIRCNVAKYPFPNRQSQPDGILTVSIGIAGYPADASSYIELIDYADAALYSVKGLTRNNICKYKAKI